jgi:hypothetical protein
MIYTNTDLHLAYRRDTGKYVPEQIAPENWGVIIHHSEPTEIVAYTKWLEDKLNNIVNTINND